MSTAETVGEPGDGFTPLSLEEAQALMSEALTDVDRDALLAERAEAEAQLRAAEATLGAAPASGNGRGDSEQEREEPAQKPHDVDGQSGSVGELDVDALRAAAARAREADDEVALAASEASERPPAIATQLGTAESAFGRMLEIREELPATWRRLVGALISATGMAIVIGALGWNVYWLLVPIALILIMTVDLRLAGKSLREASAQASEELASVGGFGPDELDRIRSHRTRTEQAEARLAAARAEREVAYRRFEELAPGRRPSEVDEIIAEYEEERAARAAAEAEQAAQAEAERAEAERAEAERAETQRVEAERVEAERAETQRVEAEGVEAERAETQRVEAEGVEAERAETQRVEAERTEPDGTEPERTDPERAEAEAEEAATEDQPVPEPVEPEATMEMPALSDPPAAPAPAETVREPAAAETVREPAAAETVREPAAAVTASEWWFGTTEVPDAPPAAAAPVRALAERLSAEGREALARIQAQLDALDRVELAKKSLEWHEANGSREPKGSDGSAAGSPPEQP